MGTDRFDEYAVVAISRALASTTFPANFVLIAALNPCPCGYRNDPRRDCQCSIPQIEKYMGKISGPLLDRIDIHIEVPSTDYEQLASRTPGVSSAEMREQVIAARKAQAERFADLNLTYNANLSSRQLRTFCQLDDAGMNLMKSSVNEMGLSARAHDKILRVSRTIADLDASDRIESHHVSEAINYRILDRQIWN